MPGLHVCDPCTGAIPQCVEELRGSYSCDSLSRHPRKIYSAALMLGELLITSDRNGTRKCSKRPVATPEEESWAALERNETWTNAQARARSLSTGRASESTGTTNRGFGMGTASRSVIAGYDCPYDALVLPAITHTELGTLLRCDAICVFERDSGKPSHWAYMTRDILSRMSRQKILALTSMPPVTIPPTDARAHPYHQQYSYGGRNALNDGHAHVPRSSYSSIAAGNPLAPHNAHAPSSNYFGGGREQAGLARPTPTHPSLTSAGYPQTTVHPTPRHAWSASYSAFGGAPTAQQNTAHAASSGQSAHVNGKYTGLSARVRG
ncbi:hypothetical protein GGX14DRAFT_403015 [Mycena pura]|uniref:Uncharacterized protein n=1 Tax=Mycena pura TaxID=153505 RepID=A0AAD6V3Z7_9AGAR|nr:hypothetical protein GGX14DRAFT_403015 [Mycena pura]